MGEESEEEQPPPAIVTASGMCALRSVERAERAHSESEERHRRKLKQYIESMPRQTVSLPIDMRKERKQRRKRKRKRRKHKEFLNVNVHGMDTERHHRYRRPPRAPPPLQEEKAKEEKERALPNGWTAMRTHLGVFMYLDHQ